MSALAAGRGISLPSLSAAGAAFAAHTHRRLCAHPRAVPCADRPASRRSRSGSAAWPRRPICSMPRAGMTCAAHRPRPQARGGHRDHEGAGDRAHARDRSTTPWTCTAARASSTARRTISARSTARVPIGITVEGANIVTRSLIQFGQGAIRCHPYLLKEMTRARGPRSRARARRVRPAILGPCRAQRRQRVARLGPRLDRRDCSRRRRRCRRRRRRFYRQLGRYASAFALAVDVALLRLGGGAQAAGDGLGALRRRALRALSVVRRAQALEGRGPPGGGSAAGGVVHGERASPPSRRGSTRSSRTFPTGRWRGSCAF